MEKNRIRVLSGEAVLRDLIFFLARAKKCCLPARRKRKSTFLSMLAGLLERKEEGTVVDV